LEHSINTALADDRVAQRYIRQLRSELAFHDRRLA
jgi:hypothetical protein